MNEEKQKQKIEPKNKVESKTKLNIKNVALKTPKRLQNSNYWLGIPKRDGIENLKKNYDSVIDSMQEKENMCMSVKKGFATN